MNVCTCLCLDSGILVFNACIQCVYLNVDLFTRNTFMACTCVNENAHVHWLKWRTLTCTSLNHMGVHAKPYHSIEKREVSVMPSGLPHKPVRSFQQTDTHEVFSVHAFRNTCAQNMVQDSFSHHVDHIWGQAHKHTHTHMASFSWKWTNRSKRQVHAKYTQTHARAVAQCLCVFACSKTCKHTPKQ
jgi:hypothetical protein